MASYMTRAPCLNKLLITRCTRFSFPGDGAGGYQDRIALLYTDMAVIIHRHSGQDGERFSLAPGSHYGDL